MSIKIYYDNIAYRLERSRNIAEIIEKVIRSEKKTTGDLYFILTDDSSLSGINQEFLGRNTLTDVIAFDYSSKMVISGEIYISVDTVKRNAVNYKVSLKNELLRVMIHGTLHLCGYKDKTANEKSEMRMKEDIWLNEIYGRR